MRMNDAAPGDRAGDRERVAGRHWRDRGTP
jgi:hypothetical protein